MASVIVIIVAILSCFIALYFILRKYFGNQMLEAVGKSIESLYQGQIAQVLNQTNIQLSQLPEQLKFSLAQEIMKSTQESTANLVDSVRQLNNTFITEASSRQIDLAEQKIKSLIDPIADGLTKLNEAAQYLQLKTERDYGSLSEQIRALKDSESSIVRETANLVTALRQPHTKGRWGEIQLRRVVELAGLTNHCDFVEQETVQDERGEIRPDLTIKLPGDQTIVVDAKVSLDAYLKYIDATTEEESRAALKEHLNALRSHINNLSSKRYWDKIGSAEFVVAFITPESALVLAMEKDPTLIEDAFQKKVIVASPTTLISLLKTVAYGWQRHELGRSAQQIIDAAKQLNDRFDKVLEYIKKLGNNLDKSVEGYNSLISSIQSRLLPQLKKMNELYNSDVNWEQNLEQITKRPIGASQTELESREANFEADT